MVNHSTVRVLRRAAAALDRGDRYLQVQQPLRLAHAGATTVVETCEGGRSERDADLLGALADIGWALEHVSYLPVETDAGRPRFSGDGFGVTVMGIYLLRSDRHSPAPAAAGRHVGGSRHAERPRPSFEGRGRSG